MSVTKCTVEYGSNKWLKRLKSSDWGKNYDTLVAFATKKTKKEHGKDFHLEIDGNPITSKEKFASIMKSKSGQADIRFNVKDVEIAGEDHEIKCLISYENTKFEWYYEKHEDDGDDKNHKINYDKFILFLSNKTKRDENSMKIYHLDKEGDDTDDGDIIDDCGDFELYFEDTTHKTRHFKVKAASGGYKVKIDLGEADCKESIIMTIPQHGFDNSKEEEWFNSWQDTSNEIGAKLNDSNWESKYSLNHSKQRDSIVNVSQFSSVFKNFANDDKSVDFCLKVSTGESGASGAKAFLIEKDGNTISWRADPDQETASKMWSSVLKLCKDQFGGGLKVKETPMTYHPTKNVIPVNYKENGQLLIEENIEMYWNSLKSSNDSSHMYFYIGDLPKDDTKRAVIISSKLIEQKMNSQQKECSVTTKKIGDENSIQAHVEPEENSGTEMKNHEEKHKERETEKEKEKLDEDKMLTCIVISNDKKIVEESLISRNNIHAIGENLWQNLGLSKQDIGVKLFRVNDSDVKNVGVEIKSVQRLIEILSSEYYKINNSGRIIYFMIDDTSRKDKYQIEIDFSNIDECDSKTDEIEVTEEQAMAILWQKINTKIGNTEWPEQYALYNDEDKAKNMKCSQLIKNGNDLNKLINEMKLKHDWHGTFNIVVKVQLDECLFYFVCLFVVTDSVSWNLFFEKLNTKVGVFGRIPHF